MLKTLTEHYFQMHLKMAEALGMMRTPPDGSTSPISYG
jgi:hypothetical protein